MSGAAIDGHVHLHRMFESEAWLGSAAANLDGPSPGWLLLAEAPGEDAFERLRTLGRSVRGWTIEAGGEPAALHAVRNGTLRLIMIAGRQITSREGLEVLAIGTRTAIADGSPLTETIARVRHEDAVPVLPWGFGKWWGGRGALVGRVLESDPGPLCLGDNAGRLGLGPPPRLFRRARARGIPVLPGSDPLPRPGEVGKVGRYGFILEGPLDPARPAESLKRRLRGLRAQPLVFGRPDSFWRFCSNQLAMQIRKRMAT